MAQRAKIGINGDPLGFDELLDRLQTSGIGGGSVTWVPEADTRCETLNVTANGTYVAVDAGKYGYDYVTVSVPGSSVTGRDPDTGEEVEVHKDPETGEIVETVIPVEIRVIEPPTNPYGVYVDGQTITKDGMVVKAYGANGDEMQTVPIGEVTINPTQAVYDESKDQPGGGEVDSDLITWTDQPISYSGQVHAVRSSVFEQNFLGASFALFHSGNNWTVLGAATSHSTYTIESYDPNDPTGHKIISTVNMGGEYTYNGKTACYATSNFVAENCDGATPVDGGSENRAGAIAWTILYGEGERHGAGSPQTITVSWPRPGDGAILETTFDILVGPHGGGPTGEN